MSTNQSFQGYTCNRCGVFVPYGMSHSCAYGWVNPPIQSSPGELRIAAALERIATAFEALLKRKPGAAG